MVYPIHSVMDTGPNFPQGLSYKKLRVLQFSSENPFDIPSSHHSVLVFVVSNWFTFLTLMPFQKKVPSIYHLHSSSSHTLLFTPYFSTFPSSLPDILVTWILIVIRDVSLHHQAFWAGCNKADGAECYRAEDSVGSTERPQPHHPWKFFPWSRYSLLIAPMHSLLLARWPHCHRQIRRRWSSSTLYRDLKVNCYRIPRVWSVNIGKSIIVVTPCTSAEHRT